jgi:DNA-binding NtrC family response regulator
LRFGGFSIKINAIMPLRILIVDDEQNQRDMLAGFLSRKNFMIRAADSAESALDSLSNGSFDIGLFDMKMSGIGGLELLQRVRQLNPEMQIIVITAYGTVETAVEAMRAGAYSYLCKPINLEELLEVIHKAGEAHFLLSENKFLKERLDELEVKEIVGVSHRLKEVLSEVARVAPTESSVLITGESGTGKELIARTIHSLSSRNKGRFIAVNCAAIPETLLESELLGHEKGSFTGADRRRLGRFELASGGTIFLDEVGELPLHLQVKLLRLIEERRFERVGGEDEIAVDVRLITATNRDLQKEISQGGFREDLYYRINVVHIHIPSLRERREDIMPLVDHFLAQLSAKMNRSKPTLTQLAKDLLLRYDWPGNIRELANSIERAIALARSDTLNASDFSQIDTGAASTSLPAIPITMTLRDLEKQHIRNVLLSQDYSLQKSADLLGIHRNTLRQKIKEYDIDKS